MAAQLSLTKALAKLLSGHTPSTTFLLLREILTDKEIEYVERRLRIALMLKKGSSYSQIQDELSVSAATVAGVVEQAKRPMFTKLVTMLDKEISRFGWLSQKLGR